MAGGAVAVLTGDIVRSSLLTGGERDQLLELLSGLPDSLASAFLGSGPYRIDVFRGDSWQLLVPQAALAPRVGLYFRARLRADFEDLRLDSRVGLGIGPADVPADSDLGSADGPAFRLSGQALEALGEGSGMRLEFPSEIDSLLVDSFNVLLRLVDLQIERWTPKQAFAVARALTGLTQQRIAERWPGAPISQQAVAQHLDRAGWHGVERAVEFLERAIGTDLPPEEGVPS